MRQTHKPIAKLGHSKALGYRASIMSPASDLEALVDAYGLEAIVKQARMIHAQLVKYGDSTINGLINGELNMLPWPTVRKLNINKKGKRAAA